MTSAPGTAASYPLNVTFYACDFGESFLGCCENGNAVDICTHGCPKDNLLPASFEKEYYSYITMAACTSGDWWSCTNTSPPFLGCCLSNPCLDGCPPIDLTAAIFSQNQTGSPLYSAILDATAANSSTKSASTSNAASATLVPIAGAAHSATTSPSSIHKRSTTFIVGGVVGSIVILGAILMGMLVFYRRLKSQRYTGSISTRHENKNMRGKPLFLRKPCNRGYFSN